MKKKLACLWVVLAVVSVGASASAQGINSERFRPALDRFGFLGINGSGTPGHGRWNLGFFTWYSNRPLRIVYDDGVVDQIIDHRMTGDIFAEVGLFGRWSLAIEVPLVFYQTGESIRPIDGRTSFTGFALEDPRFTTKIRFFGKPTEETQNKPDGPGLGLLFTVPIPVGNEGLYASEGQFTFDAQLLADFHLLGTGAGAMLGWRYRVNNRTFGRDTLGQEIMYGASIKPPIPKTKDLYGLLELRGTSTFRGRMTNTLEGDIGIRWTTHDITLTAAFGGGFVRGLGQPRLRAIVGMSWSPQTDDLDADGIPDDRDECPRLPEDLDGFEDEDGCMDPDNDNDFIPDVDDKCPNEEAIEGRDLDEDGCTDPP